MITVIDMASSELIHSSIETADDTPERREEVLYPSLALQEVQPEPESISMPPELAECAADEFLAKFK